MIGVAEGVRRNAVLFKIGVNCFDFRGAQHLTNPSKRKSLFTERTPPDASLIGWVLFSERQESRHSGADAISRLEEVGYPFLSAALGIIKALFISHHQYFWVSTTAYYVVIHSGDF